ncbi:hypothetical protein ACF053_27340 [Streptomyces kanasensis]|uniref:hypothetical protein n=1 Tax=Streptomyces kanasensis TaxID=936756 RepID=UPI0036FF0513
MARDWAEEHRRSDRLRALLSGTTTFGTEQPAGLVADHNHLTKIISDSLGDADRSRRKRGMLGKTHHEETAKQLAWWPAVALSDDTDGFIPVTALRTTLVEAVLGGLADDIERTGRKNRSRVSLGDIRRDVVKLLDWYILREPAATPSLFGDICLTARLRLGLPPKDVGDLLRHSLHLDSQLDGDTVDALMDLALPPSATRAGDR